MTIPAFMVAQITSDTERPPFNVNASISDLLVKGFHLEIKEARARVKSGRLRHAGQGL